MRLIRYRESDQGILGCVSKSGDVHTIAAVSEALGLKTVDSIQELIENWDQADIQRASQWVEGRPGVPESEVELLCPMPWPKRNVFCLGKNYVEHAKELEGQTANLSGIPEHPIYFTKTASPAIGPGETIRLYEDITGGDVDYEVELAIIIGKQGTNISKDAAETYIFGYTILNDVSVRSLQTRHIQWFRGKCMDTHTVLGPAVVTKDAVDLPLKLQCTINEDLRQDGSTDCMIFDIPTIIADLSRGTTLYPGDIIATGTPAGVGMGFKPPKYLKNGDLVQCAIEGIGILKNPVGP